MESDPIGLRGGLSTYGYVDANPHVLADPDGLRPSMGAEPDPPYRWRPQPGAKYPKKLDGQCLLLCMTFKLAFGYGIGEATGLADGPLRGLGQTRIAGALAWARKLGRSGPMALVGLGGTMEVCESRCEERQVCPIPYNSPARSDFPALPPMSFYRR